MRPWQDESKTTQQGWVQRSYLKRDGWRAQLVMAFVGPRRDVAVAYDPDDPKRVTMGADVVEHDPVKFIPLDALIAQHIAGAHPPSSSPLDRAAIEANVRWWADGPRRIASEVL
jgi:hypothetical protein